MRKGYLTVKILEIIIFCYLICAELVLFVSCLFIARMIINVAPNLAVAIIGAFIFGTISVGVLPGIILCWYYLCQEHKDHMRLARDYDEFY